PGAGKILPPDVLQRGDPGPGGRRGPPPNALVFWYPEFTRLGLNAKDQQAYVTDSGRLALPQYARYQVKFAISSHLQCYLLFPRREAESREIAEVVREGLRRFGGRAVVFVRSGPSRLVR